MVLDENKSHIAVALNDVIFQCLEQHKLNFIHLHCTVKVADILALEIKLKLSAW